MYKKRHILLSRHFTTINKLLAEMFTSFLLSKFVFIFRKLCTECKCRKEDHEIEDGEDCIQFEILFGAKKVQKTILKYNSQNNSFDWIPPNVSTELVINCFLIVYKINYYFTFTFLIFCFIQAIDYLKLIPQSKLPLSNSDGARYRKQQLEKQVPLHDIDPNVCHNLSAKEAEEFTKYLENLKKYVIGQGKVMKLRVPVSNSQAIFLKTIK